MPLKHFDSTGGIPCTPIELRLTWRQLRVYETRSWKYFPEASREPVEWGRGAGILPAGAGPREPAEDEHSPVDGTRDPGESEEFQAQGRSGFAAARRSWQSAGRSPRDKRGNDTDQSATDPEAHLYKKGKDQEAKLAYLA